MARSIVMPSMGMYMTEGLLIHWLCPAGEYVELRQPIAEIETEKAIFQIEAPEAGILHPTAEAGETFPVESSLGYILAQGEEPPSQSSHETSAASPKQEEFVPSTDTRPTLKKPATPTSEIRASPIARRLAAQHNIDLSRITGSGPGGRIVEADILGMIGQTSADAVPASPPRKIRQRIPLIGMRRAITELLRQNLAVAIPLTITREVRADALVALRSHVAQKTGDAPAYDALFMKILGAALREYPDLNATIADDAILLLDEVHIGFAVAVPGGIIVPVVRNADSEPLSAVAAAVSELSKKALSSGLKQSDTTGGTVTISNLGGYGVDAFTPVLNPPQSAILGIGRIAERPVVEDGRIVPAQTCILSLTFDHRVADGAPAARLLDVIARLMADAQFLNALGEPS